MSRRAMWPLTLAHLGKSTRTRCTASGITPIQPVELLPLVPSNERLKTRRVVHYYG